MVTYKVKFDDDAVDMRTRFLMLIDGITLQVIEDDYFYFVCEDEAIEAIEYELRKAERRDGYCDWKKI
jgi:hypothetical protein